jgi:hypothetical protein
MLRITDAVDYDGLGPKRVIVRPHPSELDAVGEAEIRSAVALLEHPRPAGRKRDILRSGVLRLHEAAELDLELEDAQFGTVKNGTYVPASIEADAAFWRIVGLYLAEGHAVADPRISQYRLQWCFHPTDEEDLVSEVARFWNAHGVKATVYRTPTSKIVLVRSRLLTAWWLHVFGMGRTCYEQRLPDQAWEESAEHKRALLAGLWLGDGSWSFVGGGPSVVLEYGTVSRELADGMLRVLAELEIVARLKVGRTAKSTVDTYWLVISGADQVEKCLDLVPARDRGRILESIGRQQKRIAPTGYQCRDNAAWVRIVDLARRPFSGFVYSLEVPPTHTFVTTAGIALSNCFPKDSLALKQLAANSGYSFQLLNAVIEVNELQKRRVIKKLERRLGSLRGKKIALLGLAFKPGTDDMREAPSLVLASRLQAEGAEVSAWDPVADGRFHLNGVEIARSAFDALDGADAAVLVTEWPELRELDWLEAGKRMRNRLLVDGRNMLDPDRLRAAGFEYEGIGRAAD